MALGRFYITMLKILLIILAIACTAITAPGQKHPPRRKEQGARISKAHPTVYVTYVRTGKREPIYTGESNEGIWLRLHNNTRWALVLSAYGAGGYAFAKGNEEEIGMFYGVEEIPKPREIAVGSPTLVLPPATQTTTGKDQEASKDKYQECEIPLGNWCHACSIIKLQPGKSLLFSVPREHLCKNHKLYLIYQYEWEEYAGEPEHRVYFYGTDIPKGRR